MKIIRRVKRDEDGGATVEFVIVFPVLIAIVLSMFESGWLMTKYMMLDRGVDLAVRDLKLGILGNNPTQADLVTAICDYSAIFRNCADEVRLELEELGSLGPDYPHNQADCDSRDPTVVIDPVMSISGNPRAEIMFVRACVLVDPIFPGIGLGAWLPQADGGGHQMVSYGVFKNEPS